MNPLRGFVVLGAVFGFLVVAFGAFAAHGLRGRLGERPMAVFETGVEYHALHALALLLVGVLGGRPGPTLALRVAGWAFTVGILLFSGSLYLLALSGAGWLGAITPFGGTAFLVGWAALTWHAARSAG
jgi:uncharacterized membrane protein YgdD (TMEM256/DUF423 family)